MCTKSELQYKGGQGGGEQYFWREGFDFATQFYPDKTMASRKVNGYLYPYNTCVRTNRYKNMVV